MTHKDGGAPEWSPNANLTAATVIHCKRGPAQGAFSPKRAAERLRFYDNWVHVEQPCRGSPCRSSPGFPLYYTQSYNLSIWGIKIFLMSWWTGEKLICQCKMKGICEVSTGKEYEASFVCLWTTVWPKYKFWEKWTLLLWWCQNEEGQYTDLLGCSLGFMPFKYLGIPMVHKKLRNNEWRDVIERFEKKLNRWKENCYPLGGS